SKLECVKTIVAVRLAEAARVAENTAGLHYHRVDPHQRVGSIEGINGPRRQHGRQETERQSANRPTQTSDHLSSPIQLCTPSYFERVKDGTAKLDVWLG